MVKRSHETSDKEKREKKILKSERDATRHSEYKGDPLLIARVWIFREKIILRLAKPHS